MNIIDIIFIVVITPFLIMWAWDEWRFHKEWRRWKAKVDAHAPSQKDRTQAQAAHGPQAHQAAPPQSAVGKAEGLPLEE